MREGRRSAVPRERNCDALFFFGSERGRGPCWPTLFAAGATRRDDFGLTGGRCGRACGRAREDETFADADLSDLLAD